MVKAPQFFVISACSNLSYWLLTIYLAVHQLPILTLLSHCRPSCGTCLYQELFFIFNGYSMMFGFRCCVIIEFSLLVLP